MIIKKYVLAAMQCCDTKKMFHLGFKALSSSSTIRVWWNKNIKPEI